MNRPTTFKRDAADKKTGMTLAEVSAFLKDCLDLDVPADLSTKVKARLGWSAQIQQLEVTTNREEAS